MSWATKYIEPLKAGKVVICYPKGNSMQPRINSGDKCTIAPYRDQELSKNSVVLCRVKGRHFLHKIKSIKKGRYLISNEIGRENGWIGADQIFGILIKNHELGNAICQISKESHAVATEKLSALLALFVNKEHWTKGQLAQTKDGGACGHKHPNASKYCLLGGMAAKNGLIGDKGLAVDILTTTIKTYTNGKYTSIPSFNDAPETTHEDIINVIEQAITNLSNCTLVDREVVVVK